MALVFPSNPNVGDEYQGWTWNGVKWTCTEGGGGGVSVGDTPPANPRLGDLWWNESSGQLSVWAGDAWVQAGGGAPAFEPNTTGTGDVFVLQQGPTINSPTVATPTVNQGTFNQPRVMGVTDGSGAAPGEVGEVISIQPNLSGGGGVAGSGGGGANNLSLTAGDWAVGGVFHIGCGPYGPESPMEPDPQLARSSVIITEFFVLLRNFSTNAVLWAARFYPNTTLFSAVIPAIPIILATPTIIRVEMTATLAGGMGGTAWFMQSVNGHFSRIDARRMR